MGFVCAYVVYAVCLQVLIHMCAHVRIQGGQREMLSVACYHVPLYPRGTRSLTEAELCLPG